MKVPALIIAGLLVVAVAASDGGSRNAMPNAQLCSLWAINCDQFVPAAEPTGCPATSPGTIVSRRPGAAAVFVPRGAVSILLCRYLAASGYPPSVNSHLARSRVLTATAEVGALTRRFDALPGIPKGVRFHCPFDNGSEIVAVFRYRSGPPNPVSVELSGCSWARNGHLMRFGGYLRGELSSLTPTALAPIESPPATRSDERVPARVGPLLGRPTIGRFGYGDVHPDFLSNGGDASTVVYDIHWSGWGDTTAIGYGISTYNWPGINTGSSGAARVVAFKLGRCRGQRSYNAVEWYLPGYGQRFDPGRYLDPCNGNFVGPAPVVLQCPEGRAVPGSATIGAVGMSCSSAERLVAETAHRLGSMRRFAPRGYRFIQSGFRCGTQGMLDGYWYVACQRGHQQVDYKAMTTAPLRLH